MYENLLELGTHRALAWGEAGPLHVGRVLQQGQHALLAILRKGVQVKELVVGRRQVDLEVAGVDDHAQRRMHRQRHRAHNRMGDLDGMDGERAELKAFSRQHLVQLGVFQQAVLFQFVFHVGKGELRAINRHVQLGDQPWDAANVVLMPVGEQNAADLFAVFNQVSEGGNDDIDAG